MGGINTSVVLILYCSTQRPPEYAPTVPPAQKKLASASKAAAIERDFLVETAISAAISRISATIYSLGFRLRSRTVQLQAIIYDCFQNRQFIRSNRKRAWVPPPIPRVSGISQDSTGFHRIPQGSEHRGGAADPFACYDVATLLQRRGESSG